MHTIEALVDAFSKLPGIGPRQARRFVYHLLEASAKDRKELATLIERLGGSIGQCTSCMRFAEECTPLCKLCRDQSRDKTLLLVIEKDQDLTAIEKTGLYKGHYFVLGGVITVAKKTKIRQTELVKLVEQKKSEGLSEIILGLSATTEGEMTADYIRDLLNPYRDMLTISLLGRGLATGSELEYTDKETLQSAYLGRKAI